jgi:hypothetical protein
MAKHRLTWTGDGSLDLSQVPDERGVPIVFTKPGDEAVVNEGSYRHPLVQRYLKSGLKAESLDGAVPQAPAPAPKAPAVPKTAPEPKPPAKEPEKVEVKDVMTSADKLDVKPKATTEAESSDKGTKDEPAPSKPKPRSRKGRSK